MGLDISYISNIEKAGVYSEDVDYVYCIYNPECFIYQLGSLDKKYTYRSTSKSEYGSFRAGSYSGYNHWRAELSKMAGYSGPEEVWDDFSEKSYKKYSERKLKLKSIEGKKIEPPKPFYELICFSDAEGMIGPEIAKKLYEDFIDFDEQAKIWSDDSGFMINIKIGQKRSE